MRPFRDWDDPVVWRRRDWNQQADFIVNQVMDSSEENGFISEELLENACHDRILIFSDGGLRRGTNTAAAGFVAFVFRENVPQLLACHAVPLQNVYSAFLAEAIALEMAITFLSTLA